MKFDRTITAPQRPVRAAPFLWCLVDIDGRIIVRGIPIATIEFNVEGFVHGIIDAFRPLRSTDYEFFAGELTRLLR